MLAPRIPRFLPIRNLLKPRPEFSKLEVVEDGQNATKQLNLTARFELRVDRIDLDRADI